MLKVMNNSVNGTNKVQLEGGPIGLKLSRALSQEGKVEVGHSCAIFLFYLGGEI